MTAAAGGTISVTVGINAPVESFSLENDFGVPPVTTVPDSFPATLGPFTIPAGTKPGIYSFKARARTESGESLEREILFTVGTGTSTPGTGFQLPFDLDFTAILAGALIGIAGIITLLIVILKIRKKAGQAAMQLPKQVQQKPAAQQPQQAQPAQQQQAQQQPAQPQPAAPTPAAPSAPAAGGTGTPGGQELPPWLREETNGDEKDNGY